MCTPNSFARRTSAHARAARMTPFDGTQPTLRQSPPIRCFSIRATFAPTAAAITAVTRPAVPAPITTMLYVPIGSGFTQSGGRTLLTSFRLCSSFGRTTTGSWLVACSAIADVCIVVSLSDFDIDGDVMQPRFAVREVVPPDRRLYRALAVRGANHDLVTTGTGDLPLIVPQDPRIRGESRLQCRWMPRRPAVGAHFD